MGVRLRYLGVAPALILFGLEPHTICHTIRPMKHFVRTAFSCTLALALPLLACAAMAQTRRVESFACREAERRYELIKSEIATVQLNATLFAASDKGCEPVARALRSEERRVGE